MIHCLREKYKCLFLAEYIPISDRTIWFFPAETAPCVVGDLANIYPLFAAAAASPGAISSSESFQTVLSDNRYERLLQEIEKT